MMAGRQLLPSGGQHVTFKNEMNAYDAEVTSSSSSDEAYIHNEYEDESDDLSPKRRQKKKDKTVAPKVVGVLTFPFMASDSSNQANGAHGPDAYYNADYSEFHDAFRRTFSLTQVVPENAESVPRSAMTNTELSSQKRPSEQMSESSDRSRSSAVPLKRPGADIAKSSKKAKSNNGASSAIENPSSTPARKSSVAKISKFPMRQSLSKCQSVHLDGVDSFQSSLIQSLIGVLYVVRSPMPKGTGIYKTGNWAYVPSDQKEAEVITKGVKEISAITEASGQKPSKLTRNSYRRLKSTLEGSSPATTPSQEPQAPAIMGGVSSTESSSATYVSPQPETSARRRSTRARLIPDYSNFLAPEIDDDPSTTIAVETNMQTQQERTPSTIDSPVSHDSTAVPDQLTRSTTASTVVQPDLSPERLAKPKKSWTTIVYEILANSRKPTLTLAEIIEDIKDRYPYFRSQASAETLKSSPRNPLYSHPAFYKIQRADNALAWGINPGKYYDKRTNKLLTPGSPRPSVLPSIEFSEVAAREDSQNSARPLKSSISDDRVSESTDGPHGLVISPPAVIGANESGSPITAKPLQGGVDKDSEIDQVGEIDQHKSWLGSKLGNVLSSNQPSTLEKRADGDSTIIQPVISTTLQTKSRWDEARLIHKNLKEEFTAKNVHHFLQETKVAYFKNLRVKQDDVSRILDSIFPEGLRSSESDITECAREVQIDYEAQTWASDWLLSFVSFFLSPKRDADGR